MNIPARMYVKKLILTETGTYNTQYCRPYETTVLQGHTLNALGETLKGTQSFTPSMLAGVANQVVAPSATPERQVGITGGWNEPRMRYMMEVETHNIAGGRSTIVLSGWTNYRGVIVQSSSIDPKLEFYVNAVAQVRQHVENTSFGRQAYTNVAENAQLLVDPSYIDAYSPARTHSMRPQDVYATMSLNHLSGLGDVMDTRTVLTQIPVASSRKNGLAAWYAASLLNNYHKACADNEFGVQQEMEVLEAARGYAQEPPVSLNPFFSAIQKYHDGLLTNFFTWADLQRLDPNVGNVTAIVVRGQTSHAAPTLGDVHTAGRTQEWGGSDRLTQVATILSQSVPAIMMDLTIMKVAFKTTNRRVLDGAVQSNLSLDRMSPVSTVILDAEGFSSVDLAPYMRQFAVQLEHFILDSISYHNQIDFHIEMVCDLMGETWLNISLEGGRPVTYVTPSFADALMAPVTTSNETLQLQLSQEFEKVFHHIQAHDGLPGVTSFDYQPMYGSI